jgi:hypothetical protein
LNAIENIIRQLEQQHASLDRALGALREIEGTAAASAQGRGMPGKKARGGKRHMSAEGRARIAEATRRRWAEKRAAQAAAAKQTVKPAKTTKRAMSPEGRARIAEAARRMWAERKRAGKKAA